VPPSGSRSVTTTSHDPTKLAEQHQAVLKALRSADPEASSAASSGVASPRPAWPIISHDAGFIGPAPWPASSAGGRRSQNSFRSVHPGIDDCDCILAAVELQAARDAQGRTERRARTRGHARRNRSSTGALHMTTSLEPPAIFGVIRVIWVAWSWPVGERLRRVASWPSRGPVVAVSGSAYRSGVSSCVLAGGRGGGVAASYYHPSVTVMAAVSGSPRTPM
jgi:hypothetical protein